MKSAGLLLFAVLGCFPLLRARAQCPGGDKNCQSNLKDAAFSRVDPLRSEQLARSAEVSLKRKDFRASADKASRAIELDPKNAQAFLYRARSFSGLKLYDRALGDASEGLRLAPKNLSLLRMKSRLLIRLKDYRAALVAADLALHHDPKNAAAHANKAYALGAMGDSEGMFAELRTAASLDPRFEGSLESALQTSTEGDALFLFPGEIHRWAGPDFRGSRAAKEREEKLIGTICLSGLILLIGGSYILAANHRGRSKPPHRRAV